jgi:4a-hydroxytetrahydrobiopterin dehydratase
MKTHFNSEEIAQRLVFYPDWKYEDGFLVKNYQFSSFIEAFAFITQVAMISEKINHHPVLLSNYTQLKLSIQTFDCGGITHKDFQWIEKINQIPIKKIE